IAHCPRLPDRRHQGTTFLPRPPCWDEVIHDYQLGAILDVAVGDGSLALTTVRNRITYTGFAFTDKHSSLA
ncbi:MAG: hypothetical protein ACKPKO_29220, partial [Candidatus Fonsibacter sp.]